MMAAVLLGMMGCGDKSSPVATKPTASPIPPSTTPPSARAPSLPPSVPQKGGGSAEPAQLAVVKRWLAAETRGDFAAAAATFADGAVVQNGSPLIRLRNRSERVAFTSSFPCGAEVVSAVSRKGYLLVTYRLTDRVGSKCDGPGNQAYGAIKVSGGKMTEWYRLPDPSQAPEAEAGPVV